MFWIWSQESPHRNWSGLWGWHPLLSGYHTVLREERWWDYRYSCWSWFYCIDIDVISIKVISTWYPYAILKPKYPDVYFVTVQVNSRVKLNKDGPKYTLIEFRVQISTYNILVISRFGREPDPKVTITLPVVYSFTVLLNILKSQSPNNRCYRSKWHLE